MLLLLGLSAIASVAFFLFVIAKILKTKEKASCKRRKILLSLPVLFFSVVLIYAFLGSLLAMGLVLYFFFIVTIPVKISAIISFFLIRKILKGSIIIKDWSSGFKAAYIAICIIALPCAVFVILGSIFRGIIFFTA